MIVQVEFVGVIVLYCGGRLGVVLRLGTRSQAMRSPILCGSSGQLSRASGMVWHDGSWRRGTGQLGGQRTTLDGGLSSTIVSSAHATHPPLVFNWRSRVVVCQLQVDFSGVLALEVEGMPPIMLASSWDADVLKADVGFANQIRLFVIVED